MSHWKSFGLAIFAAVCLLGETAGSALAQLNTAFATEWRNGQIINLGGLPGSTYSEALGINNAGQVVGQSVVDGFNYATEWSHGHVINLGGLPGSTESVASGINNAGQIVGGSYIDGFGYATEWSHGHVINLGSLPGSKGSVASGINNAGQIVGISGNNDVATEWSDGNVIKLGGPGSWAYDINKAGVVVGFISPPPGGFSVQPAEWVGGSVIDLGTLPGSFGGLVSGINDAGQAVGYSPFVNAVTDATEWSGGSVINLGGLPGSQESFASGINDLGQVVGYSYRRGDDGGLVGSATEWSDGDIINLGGLPGSQESQAFDINDRGQAVGESVFFPSTVPEPSTWAMMLLGFAGLAFAGYRRSARVLVKTGVCQFINPTYSDLQRRERGARRSSSPSVQ